MKVSKFVVNPIGENTYILWNGTGSEAAIVDPGMMAGNERAAIDDFVAKNELKVKMVLMTHLHFDHAASARYVADKYGVAVYASSADRDLGKALPSQMRMFGMGADMSPLDIDVLIDENYALSLNGEEIKILETPGHTQGSVAFYLPDSGVVFVGDTLFCQSIGRTDLPGGDYGQIVDSIKKKLYALPGDTLVLPGHGDSTTIDDERGFNPFVRGDK